MSLKDRMPSGWKTKNLLMILTFTIVGIVALFSAKAKAVDINISLGQSVIHTQLSTGEVAIEAKTIELGYHLIGEDVKIFSLSKLIYPQWCVLSACYYQRLGVAYIPNTDIVGNTNYRLGLGIDFGDVFAFEYFHYSSAGIHKINYGLDGIMLRVNLPVN